MERIALENGFEVVPLFGIGPFGDVSQEMIDDIMKNQSILGGQLIEGLVIKCYDVFDSRDKTLMCKYVRPEFKEMNGGEFETGNLKYKVRARWKRGWSLPWGVFGSPGQ